MYDRTFGDKILTFEPSGGLLEAALVMRDRETDSWWAIMRGQAIGGPMDGERLRELPNAEKTTWGDWRRRHPETLVLSVDGSTHVPDNHYDNYFSSDRTFRGITPVDDRLPAKEPVFAFQLGNESYVLPHRVVAGGHLESLETTEPDGTRSGTVIFFFRERGASVFASTRAWIVPPGLITVENGEYVLDVLRGDTPSRGGIPIVRALDALPRRPDIRVLPGLDTYWYTWIAVNPETTLLP